MAFTAEATKTPKLEQNCQELLLLNAKETVVFCFFFFFKCVGLILPYKSKHMELLLVPFAQRKENPYTVWYLSVQVSEQETI